jgi:S1-C subfamily serine protease
MLKIAITSFAAFFLTATALNLPAFARSSKGGNDTRGSGTGVLVAKGSILTSEHVVQSCKRLAVNRVGATSIVAHVVATDPMNDLALLKADVLASTIPPLRREARVGESVFVYGFPLAGLLAASGNFTNGIITAKAGLRDDIKSFQISAPVQVGSSGGPLLDQAGNIIGVVASKLNALRVSDITNDLAQNVNFAIKASIAIDFLEAHKVTVETVANTRTLAPADIAELAGAFTVYIACG